MEIHALTAPLAAHLLLYLPAGCSDGAIVVWDFETRGVALTLEGHQ